MPSHWHLVLRPNRDGEMGDFLRWVTATHTMRYHAHYHTSGQGHVYQGRFKSFPIQGDGHFLTVCRYVERNALRAGLVKRAEDWRWGSLWRWLQTTEPDPKLLSSWPISRSPDWLERVQPDAGIDNKESCPLFLKVQLSLDYEIPAVHARVVNGLNRRSRRIQDPVQFGNDSEAAVLPGVPVRTDCVFA